MAACLVTFVGAEDQNEYVMEASDEQIDMTTDVIMQKMEKAVAPETWNAYCKSHPAPFWLFGEDRQLSVRNNIIPDHWFSGKVIPTSFKGEANPGEFYPFQVCVVSEKARDLKWTVQGSKLCEIRYVTPKDCKVEAKGVKPIWVMLKVPQNAKQGSSYSGSVIVQDTKTKESSSFPFQIDIRGDVLQDGGVHDSWRLSRLIWLTETAGEKNRPTRNYTPLRVNESKRSIQMIGRQLQLGADGLPSGYLSTFTASNTRTDAAPQEFLSKPFSFTVQGTGSQVLPQWKNDSFSFVKKSPCMVSWKAISHSGTIIRTVNGQVGFDGCASIKVGLKTSSGTKDISGATLSIVTPEKRSPLGMGLGKHGGKISQSFDWKWNPKVHQDAFWFGSVNQGMMIRLKGENFSRALINCYYAFKPLQVPESWGNGGVKLNHEKGLMKLLAYSKGRKLTTKPLVYRFDLYLTPFHPIDLKAHLADRYFHYKPHSQKTDFDMKRKNGATVVNLHHNTVWNPYINYPYNKDGTPFLKKAVQYGHKLGMRVKIYYTTRELTQNLPEFFALKSLDGEVIMPRKEGVKWPCTNPYGPNQWLRDHVGMNIVPAWRENIKFSQYPHRLDLAVLTAPDTRWNNFYLGGLEYLVKEYGIDGLYIDDTMLNHDAMMQARRILDADGNTGRRIDMHSWNHFNSRGGYGNSAIIFMELFPFIDRTWCGEGFNYDSKPDFWLVEMSGIPFGLLGEMLGWSVRPHRGIVFAETGRWGWGSDPRQMWKFFDKVQLGDAEMIGFWDPANPVKISDPSSSVLATVYKLKGKYVIAMANFSNKETTVKWSLNSQGMNLKDCGTLDQPLIKGFQDKRSVKVSDPLTIPGRKGFIFIAE